MVLGKPYFKKTPHPKGKKNRFNRNIKLDPRRHVGLNRQNLRDKMWIALIRAMVKVSHMVSRQNVGSWETMNPFRSLTVDRNCEQGMTYD